MLLDQINKETLLFGSFSKNAGNFGCIVHNAAFQFYHINAIYKSFSINSIKQAIDAMIALDIKGAGISMPYKIECLDFVHELSEEVKIIGSANTITNVNGHLKAYNTDCFAASNKIAQYSFDSIVILGNGGYAKAVTYSAKRLGKKIHNITRKNWTELHDIRNHLIFNCTPVENVDRTIDGSNVFIDCLIGTSTGKELSLLQASKQFEIYTGLNFPFQIFGEEHGKAKNNIH